jgi:hypothetical protein
MRNNLSKARNMGRRPKWLGDHVWDGLCKHWGSDPFKEKSAKAKANRASCSEGFGGSLHVGGSITTSQHRENLVMRFNEEIACTCVCIF